MKTIYLIRHGEIDSGKPRRFIGRTDLPLTELGEKQMESLGQHLASIHLDTVICSPLTRCRQCGEILATYCKTSVKVCDDLAEINLGEWEGLTVAEVKERFPGGYEERGRNLCGYAPPGGESFTDLQKRVVQAFTTILDQPQKTYAIVAHAGVNRVLLCHLLGMPIEKMFTLNQDYGCYNRILFDTKGIHLDSLNVLSL